MQSTGRSRIGVQLEGLAWTRARATSFVEGRGEGRLDEDRGILK